ncbi:MAG TPA: hypothetical protein VGM87_04590 [Roseomonas sp.]|jgi:hypothetical protein
MRILVTVAHFYRPEEPPPRSSADATRRDLRAAAIRSLIGSYRGHYGPTQVANVGERRYEPLRGAASVLDIVALVAGEDHLLSAEDSQRLGCLVVDAKPADPLKLGFAAHRLMADHRHGYDLFVFTEDDLRIAEASFFDKILSFQEAFGPSRVLFPNRYEWNPRANALKTFIDGDLRRDVVAPYEAALPDAPFLCQPALGRSVTHRRAANPHAGFFAITAAQLAHWIRQPWFGDEDGSFVSPLESAATLGILKTFPIYKPFGPDMGWLQIEHLDNQYSALNLPVG